MAKIHEELVVIKVSKLVKDQDQGTELVGADVLLALEQVAQELLGSGALVEVEKP